MSRFQTTLGGICRVKNGGLALHFGVESADDYLKIFNRLINKAVEISALVILKRDYDKLTLQQPDSPDHPAPEIVRNHRYSASRPLTTESGASFGANLGAYARGYKNVYEDKEYKNVYTNTVSVYKNEQKEKIKTLLENMELNHGKLTSVAFVNDRIYYARIRALDDLINPPLNLANKLLPLKESEFESRVSKESRALAAGRENFDIRGKKWLGVLSSSLTSLSTIFSYTEHDQRALDQLHLEAARLNARNIYRDYWKSLKEITLPNIDNKLLINNLLTEKNKQLDSEYEQYKKSVNSITDLKQNEIKILTGERQNNEIKKKEYLDRYFTNWLQSAALQQGNKSPLEQQAKNFYETYIAQCLKLTSCLPLEKRKEATQKRGELRTEWKNSSPSYQKAIKGFSAEMKKTVKQEIDQKYHAQFELSKSNLRTNRSQAMALQEFFGRYKTHQAQLKSAQLSAPDLTTPYLETETNLLISNMAVEFPGDGEPYVRFYMTLMDDNQLGDEKKLVLGEGKTKIIITPKGGRAENGIFFSLGNLTRSLSWHDRYRLMKPGTRTDAPIRSVLVKKSAVADFFMDYLQSENSALLHHTVTHDDLKAAFSVDTNFENQIGVKSMNDYLQHWLNAHVHREPDRTISSFETIAPAFWQEIYQPDLHGTFRDIQHVKEKAFIVDPHSQKEYLMVLPDPGKPGEYVSYTASGIKIAQITHTQGSITVNDSVNIVKQVAEFSDYFSAIRDTSEADLTNNERDEFNVRSGAWKGTLKRLLEVNHLTPFHVIKEGRDAMSKNRDWESHAAKRHLESVQQSPHINKIIRKFSAHLWKLHKEKMPWCDFSELNHDYREAQKARHTLRSSGQEESEISAKIENIKQQVIAHVRSHQLIAANDIPAINCDDKIFSGFIKKVRQAEKAKFKKSGIDSRSLLETAMENFYNEADLRRYLSEKAQAGPEVAEYLTALDPQKAVSLFYEIMLSEDAAIPSNSLYALRQKLFFHTLRPVAQFYAGVSTEDASGAKPYSYEFDQGSSDGAWGQHRQEMPDAFLLLNARDDKQKSNYWYQPDESVVTKHHQKMGIPFLGGLSGTTKMIIRSLDFVVDPTLTAEEYWHFQLFIAALMADNHYHSFYEAIFIAAAYEPAYLYQGNPADSEKLGYKILRSLEEWHKAILKGQRRSGSLYQNTLELIDTYALSHAWQQTNITAALASDYPPPYEALGGIASGRACPGAVDNWQVPTYALENRAGGETDYQQQLIIQLEDDARVRWAAVSLAGKHPESSTLVQMDATGHFRVLKQQTRGDWLPLSAEDSKSHLHTKFPGLAGNERAGNALQGKVRWQLVGHGRNAVGETGAVNNSTLGGLEAEQLAKSLKTLSEATGRAPDYISMVGCALASPETVESYGYELGTLLKAQDIQADIGGRAVAVAVDGQGRKLTQGRDGQWHYKKSEDKVLLQWNSTGELMIRRSLEPETERVVLLLEALWQGERLPGQLNREERQHCYDFFALQSEQQLDSLLCDYTIQRPEAAQLRAAVMTLGQEDLLQKERLISLENLNTLENVTEALKGETIPLPFFSKRQSLLPSLFKTAQKLFTSKPVKKITGIAGHLTQGLGSASSLLSILSRKAALAASGLSEAERSAMQHEIDLSTADLTVGLMGNGMELAAHPFCQWLLAQQPEITKLMQRGLYGVARQLQGSFSTLPQQTLSLLRFAAAGQANTLLRLTGMGVQALGPLFAAAGIGFGLYDFSQAIIALQTETDSKKRQDLQVRAAFAITGVLTGLGTAVVPIAVAALAWLAGATAVTAAAMASLSVAGPLGLAIGALLFIGAWIYGGVRRVEEVGKEITLSDLDKFRIGWSSISGSLPPDVKIRYEAAALAAQVVRSLEESSHAFLNAHTQYDAVYYSSAFVQPGHVIDQGELDYLIQWAKMQKLYIFYPEKTTDPEVVTLINDRVKGDKQPKNSHDKGDYEREIAFFPRVAEQAIPGLADSYSSGNLPPRKIAHPTSSPFLYLSENDFGLEKRSDILIRHDSDGNLKAWTFGRLSGDLMVMGDFDGDGQEDVLLRKPDTSTDISTLSFRTEIRYGKATPVPSNERYHPDNFNIMPYEMAPFSNVIWMLSGDVNGDGCTDLLLIYLDKTIKIKLLQGRSEQAQPFEAAITLPDAMGYISTMLRTVFYSFSYYEHDTRLFLHDINRDGRADLVTIDNNLRTQVALAEGSGAFSAPVDSFTLPELRGHALEEGARILGIEEKTQRLMVITPTAFQKKSSQIELHRFIRDRQAYVMLGKGSDTFNASGNPKESAYFFDCEEGNKEYTGGQRNDIFLLRNSAALAESSLDGGAGENILILEGYGGSEINLKKERDNINRITLRNIQHIHVNNDFFGVRISGNEQSNHFTDRGKNSVLRGYEGSDVLTLADGLAVGGKGSDHYIIVKPVFDGTWHHGFNGSNITIELYEEERDLPGDGAINRVELQDYLAADIREIILAKGKITLFLNNNDERSSDLSIWGSAAEYLFVTRDGLQFTLSPLTDSEEYRRYDINNRNRLAVTYQPEWDKTRQGPEKQITLSRLEDKHKITVSRQDGKAAHLHQLPLFMQLHLQDTPFDDRLIGNHEEERLESHQGWDILQGNGGSDHYIISAMSEIMSGINREVWIDNDDILLAEDTLHLPWSVTDTALHWKGQDLVLTDKRISPTAASVKIHLKNFALAAQYRHLKIEDESKKEFALIYQESDGAVKLFSQPLIGESPAPEILYTGTTNITLGTAERVEGQRLISMSSQGALLRGGKGRDFLMATAGKNQFEGGQGNDEMAGGEGDDLYIFRPGEGKDTLTDYGGNDTLMFEGRQKEELHFSQAGNNLMIIPGNAKDSLTITHQFTEDKQQAIECIKLNDGSYLLLAEAIVAFRTGIQNHSPVSLQQHLNLAWRCSVTPYSIKHSRFNEIRA